MSKKLYMAVTADRYELPMVVYDTLTEISRSYGMTAQCMNSYIYRGIARKQDGVKFVRINLN